MRIAALVIGITAAVLGLVAVFLAFGLGGIGRAVGAENTQLAIRAGWSSLVFDLLGFLGAGLALAKPKIAGALLLVTAVGFTLSLGWIAIVSGPLFLMAGLFAVMGSGRRPEPTPPRATPDSGSNV